MEDVHREIARAVEIAFLSQIPFQKQQKTPLFLEPNLKFLGKEENTHICSSLLKIRKIAVKSTCLSEAI